jgi:hypothetical protein
MRNSIVQIIGHVAESLLLSLGGNIQGAVGNPKFMKISDFAADRPTGFITWQFFQVEKIQNFALQLN